MSVASTARPAPTTRPLTLKNFLGYGAGDMSNNLAFSLVMTFLALYLTDVALINPATVALLFLIMRIVDAFTDLVIGSVIDRTSTRWGKFRPYILVFSIPLAITAVLTFSMPSSLHGTTGAVVYATVTYFLLGSVFFTLVNVPYGSLAAAMTQVPGERAKLATSRSLGAAVMQVLTALVISPLIRQNSGDAETLQSSLTIGVSVLAVLAVALHMFLFATTREQVQRSSPRVSLRDVGRTLASNRALIHLCAAALIFLTGLFTLTGLSVYYIRDIYGDIGYTPIALTLLYGTVIALGPFAPRLIDKFGKRTLFVASALSGMSGGVILFFAPSGSFLITTLGFLFLGLGSGLGNLLMWNLEADTIDYGEWRTGQRTEGSTYAVFSFTRKLGQSVGGALGLWVIGLFGYVGGVEPADETLLGIRIATGLIPAGIFLVAALLMLSYPLTDKLQSRVVSELRVRHGNEDVATKT